MNRIVAVLALLLAAAPARGTPGFPDALAAHLGATARPSCSVCHAGGATGNGTVTTPFGAAMRARGLVAFDEGSLAQALDRMAADQIDSNGDGVTDVEELQQGLDPNAGAAATGAPSYGCVGRVAGGARPSGELALLAAAALLWRTRRGRRPIS